MRLTRPNVNRLALPPGKSEQIVFDETLPCFGIRIRAGGKRTWIVQYRIGHRQRRVTIGTVDAVDPDEARRRAKNVLAKAQLGGDPQSEKIENRFRAALTLGSVAERYLETYAAARMKPKTLSDTGRYLRVSWKPLHDLPLSQIERRIVSARMSEIATENGGISANRARTALSSLFSWAMREGLAELNPVAGTNRAIEEQSRDYVIPDEHLTAFGRPAGKTTTGALSGSRY
jgi:hypothetical protein